eukprot:3765297-Prymnesium_polylepis.1
MRDVQGKLGAALRLNKLPTYMAKPSERDRELDGPLQRRYSRIPQPYLRIPQGNANGWQTQSARSAAMPRLSS